MIIGYCLQQKISIDETNSSERVVCGIKGIWYGEKATFG